MTATIKPPGRGTKSRRRTLRFSSMESLGFSDAAFIWSDTPVPSDVPKGRHVARPPEPDTLADWQPAEFGGRLHGGNVRWSLVIGLVLLLGGLASFGYWLYQRPAAQQRASVADVTARATALSSSLPALDELNDNLLLGGRATGTGALSEVESDARALFNASGALDDAQTEMRSASSQAAGSALDAIRLAGNAHSYRDAVLPVLVTPELQTDPALIALDEAARSFGDWQLSFENVRTALPDGVLSDVSERLDVLSGDLTSILDRYIDALREDSVSAANGVTQELGSRLSHIDAALSTSLEEIQSRVETRIGETRQSLERLLDG